MKDLKTIRELAVIAQKAANNPDELTELILSTSRFRAAITPEIMIKLIDRSNNALNLWVNWTQFKKDHTLITNLADTLQLDQEERAALNEFVKKQAIA